MFAARASRGVSGGVSFFCDLFLAVGPVGPRGTRGTPSPLPPSRRAAAARQSLMRAVCTVDTAVARSPWLRSAIGAHCTSPGTNCTGDCGARALRRRCVCVYLLSRADGGGAWASWQWEPASGNVALVRKHVNGSITTDQHVMVHSRGTSDLALVRSGDFFLL